MSDSLQIILASSSAARQNMLLEFNLRFDVIPANIDEEKLVKKFAAQDIEEITKELAKAKALHISSQYPDALVIGSDQTLEFEEKLLTKAADPQEAEAKLKMLRGKTHILRSSVCVAQSNQILFSYIDRADLSMHDFDDDALQDYMRKDPEALTSCVGAYKIEGEGANLFSSVSGDQYTIMGMPLIPLLNFLRKEYEIRK